jgi:glycogen debranching enzyme
VRDLEKVPYLGDQEYHGPTIWPRDTPYLLALMEHVGQSVEGLLINNLDHMIAEGAVGYCSELFSLPVGGESITRPESENPVPVKNPAQYWSHWCDPYLKHLPRLLADEQPLETGSVETPERPSC